MISNALIVQQYINYFCYYGDKISDKIKLSKDGFILVHHWWGQLIYYNGEGMLVCPIVSLG